MAYVVKEGKSVIYGDAEGEHHRYVGGETVEGAKRGELRRCSAVEWRTSKESKSEKPAETGAKPDVNEKPAEAGAEPGVDEKPAEAADQGVDGA